MNKPTSPFRSWLRDAPVKDQQTVARAAQTSPKYLHHIATGYRVASAAIAARIEEGMKLLPRVKGTPPLDRRDICSTCATCPFARRK